MSEVDVKPGYRTTQFWALVALTIAGFMVQIASTYQDEPWAQAVGLLGGLLAQLLGFLGYNKGRTIVTTAATTATTATTTTTSRPTTPPQP